MDFYLMILSVIALVVLVTVVYPKIQDARERELAKRLQQTHDPRIAMFEVDTVNRQHQHEAGFFRFIVRYIWPIFFR
jgi:hypothetical protein